MDLMLKNPKQIISNLAEYDQNFDPSYESEHFHNPRIKIIK